MPVPQPNPAQVAADTSGARVVDVREPDEVATGAIAGGMDAWREVGLATT